MDVDPASRRPTSPQPPSRGSSTARNGQCTHITMTRVYNRDFRCGLCLRVGDFGWLYRCTQDRELIIEDDFERGQPMIFDQLPCMFPLQHTPKQRSPAARTVSELSFFNEVNEEQLKTYTTQQIKMILKQRADVIKSVKQYKPLNDSAQGLHILSMQTSVPASVLPAAPEVQDLKKKSWIPVNECQFKVCHHCRGQSADRAWLSLNGVAQGDLPPTAITGYGFHIQGKRPVALVGNILNLGLRRNPSTTPASKIILSPPQSPKSPYSTPSHRRRSPVEPPSPFDDDNDADTCFGQDSNAYDSAAMTRKLNAERVHPVAEGSRNRYVPPVQAAFQAIKLSVHDEIKHATKQVSEAFAAPDVRPPWTPPVSPTIKPTMGKDVELCQKNSEGIYGRSDNSLKTNPERRSYFNLDSLVTHDNDVGLFLPLNIELLNRAASIPLPIPTPSENINESPTLMEVAESDGVFGSEPLVVANGVAVTEEAVQQHAPDIIMSVRMSG